MLRRKIALLVAALALLLVVSLGTLYAFQKPEPPKPQPVTDACSCSGGAVTAGVAIIHCTCGNANCLVARSVATPGSVAASCK